MNAVGLCIWIKLTYATGLVDTTGLAGLETRIHPYDVVNGFIISNRLCEQIVSDDNGWSVSDVAFVSAADNVSAETTADEVDGVDESNGSVLMLISNIDEIRIK